VPKDHALGIPIPFETDQPIALAVEISTYTARDLEAHTALFDELIAARDGLIDALQALTVVVGDDSMTAVATELQFLCERQFVLAMRAASREASFAMGVASRDELREKIAEFHDLLAVTKAARSGSEQELKIAREHKSNTASKQIQAAAFAEHARTAEARYSNLAKHASG